MKIRTTLVMAFVSVCLVLTLSACSKDRSSKKDQASVDCSVSKDGIPTCIVTLGSANSDAKYSAKKCIYTCTKENGVWVCRGSGPECNGQTPFQ